MNVLETPYYYIKEEDLLYDIALLRHALEENWGNFVMGYSVKTNALPWLLTYLKKEGFYAELVSDEEYHLTKALGYDDKTMIYNGPIKNRSLFDTILLHGGYVNFDSTQELDWIEELSRSHKNHRFRIGLRVNCDIASLCPDELLVNEQGGRFGYCYENGILSAAIARIKPLGNVHVAGLHLHSSTQSRTVSVYRALAAMAGRIAKEYELSLDYVDMGGGYFGGRPDKPDYRDYFTAICQELKQHFDPALTTLIAEPGVSLVSRATSFHTTVMDIKKMRAHSFVVTDGSRTNLNPLVTRHVYPHHLEYEEDKETRPIVKSQWICGFTCMEYDRLFEIKNGRALMPGDRIVYDTAGGYTLCLNPLFIRYLPPVYVEHSDGTIFTAREKWGIEEFLAKNYTEDGLR